MAAKKTIKLPGFGLGLLVGAFVTTMYFKKKYDCITIHIDEKKQSEECPDFVEGNTHQKPDSCNCKKDCGETDVICEECMCSDCQAESCDDCSVK